MYIFTMSSSDYSIHKRPLADTAQDSVKSDMKRMPHALRGSPLRSKLNEGFFLLKIHVVFTAAASTRQLSG